MKNKKIEGLGFSLLFVLPIAGFITSLFNIRSKTSAFIYIVFAMLFGYSISFSNTSADSYRYAEAFARFDNTLTYNSIVRMYQSGELRDMYRLLLFYLTSIFSSNPKVMYAIAGAIYGVFSYLSLLIFVKERGRKWDKYIFILSTVFFTYISISNINGFRFWTGALVLFYSSYNFFILKNKKWLIGLIITPLFHYGFILLVPVLIFYRIVESFLYNNKTVGITLFYTFIMAYTASWFLNTNAINLSFISQDSFFSGAIGNRLEYINSSDVGMAVDQRRDNSLFLSVQTYFDYGIKIYVLVVILCLRRWLKAMTGVRTEYVRLFAFVLFFYAFAFIATSIPSGGRFLNIAHLFLIILLGKFYAIYKGKDIRKLIFWALPVFLFNITFINGLLPILILIPKIWYANIFWIIIDGIDFYI